MQHKKQESVDALLSAIDKLNRELGRRPTNAELCAETRLGAGTISRYLNYMNEQGLVEFEPRRILRVIHENEEEASVECAWIPVVGSIPCGSPDSATEEVQERVPIPCSILGTGRFFLLRTYGDSMVNAGIEPDDLVLVRQTQDAEVENIVAALTADGETTLKRLAWDAERKRYFLQPENDAYEPIYECFSVQGVVTKIIKEPR